MLNKRKSVFALAALLVCGAVAGVLALRAGGGDSAEPSRVSSSIPRKSLPGRAPPFPATVVSADEPGSSDAGDSGKEDAEEPTRFGTITGSVLREGDAPAAGVEFLVGDTNLPMMQVYAEGETDETGRFNLRYPEGIPFAIRVNCEFAWIKGIEGAESYDHNRNIFTVPDPSRAVRFRVTSFEKYGHLRCVDARTGKVLRRTVRTEYAGSPDAAFEEFSEYTPRHGGWIPVGEDHFPYPVKLPGRPEDAEVRISVPGYAPVTRHHREIRGWVTVPLEPVTADVTGTIVLAKELGDARVRASLRQEVPGAQPLRPQLRGIPETDGPFFVHDLPPGSYVLFIRAETEKGEATLEKRFEKGAGPVDLGILSMELGARARVRVLDGGGRLVWQAPVALTEVGAESPPRGGGLLRGPTGEFEWYEFADLRPGARYRVAAKGPDPSPTKEFTAPGKSGDQVSIDLIYGERLVDCLIHVLFDGAQGHSGWTQAPEFPDSLTWTLGEGANGASIFRGELLPGTYRLGFVEDSSTLTLGATPRRLEGEIKVVAGQPIDMTLDVHPTAK